MSTALRRIVGSPKPFDSFLAMRKEQYKIKSKLICYPFYFLLDQKVTKSQNSLIRFTRYQNQNIFWFW
jgi:hypothetical protein